MSLFIRESVGHLRAAFRCAVQSGGLESGLFSRAFVAGATTKSKKKTPAPKAAIKTKESPARSVVQGKKPSTSTPAFSRPPSAYNLFMKAEFKNLKKSDPEIKLADATKRISAMWSQVSMAEKERYKNDAKKLQDAAKKAGLTKKKSPEEKRPPSAYMMFIKEMYAAVRARFPNDDFSGISRRIAEMWRNVAPDEKKMRLKKAQTALKEFNERGATRKLQKA